MLHLLPIRIVLWLGTAAIATTVLAATYVGWLGEGDTVRDAEMVIRWSSGLPIIIIVLLFAAWRWINPLQLFIFPYLGGSWSGEVAFKGKDGLEKRNVRLEVKHTLFGLKFLLDSDEATSKTLVAYAERDGDFNHYRIYYVYLNERKEGVAGAGENYRGLAVLRVECGLQPKLHGDYFTEKLSGGTIHLLRDAAHPWWKLWR